MSHLLLSCLLLPLIAFLEDSGRSCTFPSFSLFPFPFVLVSFPSFPSFPSLQSALICFVALQSMPPSAEQLPLCPHQLPQHLTSWIGHITRERYTGGVQFTNHVGIPDSPCTMLPCRPTATHPTRPRRAALPCHRMGGLPRSNELPLAPLPLGISSTTTIPPTIILLVLLLQTLQIPLALPPPTTIYFY